jgi:hypothetical protein
MAAAATLIEQLWAGLGMMAILFVGSTLSISSQAQTTGKHGKELLSPVNTRSTSHLFRRRQENFRNIRPSTSV